ncbi:MAG: NAD(P)/FAD-dependent oxidoreductase [Ferruginibacter sp.]
MTAFKKYDITVIGGGLAGLSAAIQLAKAGYAVALFEKEKYPFNKVCGEYISLESERFLEELGVSATALRLPRIAKLRVSAPDGCQLEHPLPLGGFGISRYKLDTLLKEIAGEQGVVVYEECKVDDVIFMNGTFHLQTTNGRYCSTVCCGSFGKRSNLDVKWHRPFITKKPGKLNNYIAVKYHVRTDFPDDTIALHNFSNGYCGISRIEDDKYCLCYLTNAQNLKDNGNSITEMEQNVLHRNPHLKAIFENCEMLLAAPVTISQISFFPKSQVDNHILLLGDAAGVITPLCGNGMSMALHSSKIAAALISRFMKKEIEREQMEKMYIEEWEKNFAGRLKTGRRVQRFFGHNRLTSLFIRLMKKLPGLTTYIIRKTHGRPF